MNELFESVLNKLKIDNHNNYGFLGLPGSIDGGNFSIIIVEKKVGPKFVLKISRTIDATKFKKEFSITNELYNYNDFFKKTLAEPLFLNVFENKNFMVSRYIRGDTLLPKIKNNIPQPDISKNQYDLIVQFLKSYYSFIVDTERKKSKKPDSALITKFFLENFNFSEKELLNMNNVLCKDYFFSLQHGDFTRHNILKKSNSIAVIDWTDIKSRCLTDDYFHFVVNYFLQIRSSKGIEGILDAFKNTFIVSNEYSKLILKITKDYFLYIGISFDQFYDYLVLFLVDRCIDEANKLQNVKFSEFSTFTKSILTNLNSNNRNDSIIWYHILKYVINNKEELQIHEKS